MPEWVIVVGRGILILVTLFIVTKWLGKKQLSQLSFFEYIIGITIGSIGAEVITGLDRSFVNGVIGIAAFVAIPIIVDKLSMKSKKLRDFFEGKGTVLIQNGNIIEESLRKEKYTTDELLELLRKKDVYTISDVEFAILEPTGDLNLLLKKEKQPVTAADLNLQVSPIKEPSTVIMDGEIMEGALRSIGKSIEWLNGELSKLSLKPSDVFIGQVDSSNQLIIDYFDEVIKEKTNVPQKDFIIAQLKRCQADLDYFSLATLNEKTMLMFQKNSDKLQKTIQDLKRKNE